MNAAAPPPEPGSDAAAKPSSIPPPAASTASANGPTVQEAPQAEDLRTYFWSTPLRKVLPRLDELTDGLRRVRPGRADLLRRTLGSVAYHLTLVVLVVALARLLPGRLDEWRASVGPPLMVWLGLGALLLLHAVARFLHDLSFGMFTVPLTRQAVRGSLHGPAAGRQSLFSRVDEIWWTESGLFQVSYLIRALLAPICYLPVMAWLHPPSLALGAALVVAAGAEWRWTLLRHPDLPKLDRKMRKHRRWSQQALSKLELVLTYGLGNAIRRAQRRALKGYFRLHVGDSAEADRRRSARHGIARVLLAGLLVYGATRVAAGELGVGELLGLVVAFWALAESTLHAADNAPNLRSTINHLMTAKETLAETRALREEGVRRERRRRRVRRAIEGHVALDGVSFAYDPGRPVLRDLSLAIPAGQSVGLAGENGAGKSTLVRLLCGQLSPNTGRVLVDGLPLDQWGRDLWRQCFVLTDVPRMHSGGTLRHSLTLLRPGATEAELWDALERAQAAEFVRALTRGLDTDVGIGEGRFALGERQRLLFAGLFLRAPRIVILDEATSALDTIGEERLLAHLSEFLRGRTAIVASHRLSMLLRLDRVALIEDGRVADDGAVDELLRRRGRFHELFRRQLEVPAAPALPEGGS